MNMSHVIWVEKYRPQKISECILPNRLKDIFQGIINDGVINNLLLYGTAGVGKTTVAKALCAELGLDNIIINGSNERNIDTIRNNIMIFASAKAFNNKRKVVIIDEADYLNPLSQAALRNIIEEFANNCSFILTCNYKNKIISPIHSRCACYNFAITKEEKKDLIIKVYTRIVWILKNEKVQFDSKVLSNFIVNFYPDIRRIINELQGYAKASNVIDEGILANTLTEQDFTNLISYLQKKDFKSIKNFCYSNSDIDTNTFYRELYEHLLPSLEQTSIPQAILILHDYMYKSCFVFDGELNILACLIDLMVNCIFRS